jgi:hypothetical protein
MPDEETISESVRPSMVPRQARARASAEFAQHVANVVAPVLLAMPDAERGSEGAVMAAVARVLTSEVVEKLAAVLKDVDSDASKEVMSGDLSAISLAEIMQILQMQRQTGVLRISNQKSGIGIFIRQGLIDFVSAKGLTEEFRLGRYFLQKGLVMREQIDVLVQSSRAGKKLMGEALVEAGIITKDDVTDALTRQSSELIYEVLRWPYGRFSFRREDFGPEAESAKLGLGISGIVLEGFRRVDEWRLMEGTINFDQVVVIDQMARDALADDKLTSNDKLVLGAVNGTRTVNEVIKESNVSSFDAIKAVYGFLQSRVLRPRAT